jgi:sugar phosphate isomerase/epimerase
MSAVHRQITLADRTLGSVTPLEHVTIAAELGYDGVSLRINPSADHRGYVPAASALMQQTRRLLADTGLFVLEAESVRLTPNWSVAETEPYLAACGELGARFLVTVADDAEESRVAANIAALAEAAAVYGTRVAMEFMVYVGVNSLQKVSRVLDTSGRSDAAILIDALHLHRAHGTPADLAAVNPSRLPYFQICDAPRAMPPDSELRREARSDRRLPGEGDLPLVDLIRAMPRDGVISVEAPCARLLAELGDRGVCRRALVSTQNLLKTAIP